MCMPYGIYSDLQIWLNEILFVYNNLGNCPSEVKYVSDYIVVLCGSLFNTIAYSVFFMHNELYKLFMVYLELLTRMP